MDPAPSAALADNVTPKPTPAALASDPPSHGASAPRWAYVTVVMAQAAYACGAMVLAHSLRATGSAVPLVALVTPDVAPQVTDALEAAGVVVRPTPYLEARAVQAPSKRFRAMYAWIDKCFTKVRAVGLTEYDRVVFLDADMLAVANPDELFAVPAPAGVCSTIDEASATRQAAQHGRPLARAEVAEAVRTNYGIRGCTLVLEPSAADLAGMLALLERHGGYGDERFHVGPDERLFSEYYNTARASADPDEPDASRWTHLHAKFGFTSWKAADAPYAPVLLHFVSEKPWAYQTYWNDFQLWEDAARALMADRPAVAAFVRAHSRVDDPRRRVHGCPLGADRPAAPPPSKPAPPERWRPPQWDGARDARRRPYDRPPDRFDRRDGRQGRRIDHRQRRPDGDAFDEHRRNRPHDHREPQHSVP